MENHLMIDASNGGFLYNLFYVLAFLSAYAIIIYEGYRRNFPVAKWILILACIRLFVVIGTKAFSISPEDWSLMIQTRTLFPNPEKTMFGGVILGVAGYLAASYFLKFRYPVWDTVAIAFPVAVSIQTVGCFFYGCCFGNPSALPWAVQYPVMTLAHYHQFQSGMLTYNDLSSLPVHPVQLYNCLGGILVTYLVIRFRKSWKAQGSLFLSSVILFALVRILIEFFRDPLSNKTGGEMLWIMKQVQWQYLLFALLMTFILVRREKSFKVNQTVVKDDQVLLKKQIPLLLLLMLVFVILHKWFTMPEIIALNIALFPAVISTGIEIHKATVAQRYRWVYICSLILPLFLMSQTFPQAQIDTSSIKKYKTYQTIGAGYATGNYTDNRMNYSGSGCDMISNHEYFSQKYNVVGGGYSYTKEDSEKGVITIYGANIMGGKYRQFRQSDSLMIRKSLWGISPYIQYETKWIGIGGGIHLGSLAYTTGDHRKNYDTQLPIPTTGHFNTFLMPRFDLRIGVKRFFFGDFHIADHFPVSEPGLAFQAGIGSGFGLKNGLNLRAGFSFLESEGYYVSGYIPIKNRIVIEPLYLWTGKYANDFYTIKLPENQFSIGVSYRFGHK
jgi:phosphatidylglycerol:prolipoprotein diacylglycerol transferase